jgi:hypothetical protein
MAINRRSEGSGEEISLKLGSVAIDDMIPSYIKFLTKFDIPTDCNIDPIGPD